MNNNIFIIIALIITVCYLICKPRVTEPFVINTNPHDTTDLPDDTDDINATDTTNDTDKLLKSIDKLNKDIALKESGKTAQMNTKSTTNNKASKSNNKASKSNNKISNKSRPKLKDIAHSSIDLSKYILKSKVPAQPNIDKYILKSSVPKCKPMADMSKYILKTEIPDCPKPIDMHKYVLKSSVVIPTAIKKTKAVPDNKIKKTYSKLVAKDTTVKKNISSKERVKNAIKDPNNSFSNEKTTKLIKDTTAKLVKDTTAKLVKEEVAKIMSEKNKKYVVSTAKATPKAPPSNITTYIPGVKALNYNTNPKKCKIYKKIIREADIYGAY